MQLSLEPVGKVMGGVAGDGQHRAARPLQELGVRQQMLVGGLRLVWGAQDAGGAVGNLRIAPDEHPQVLLVGLGLGAVDDPLVKGIGGLGPIPPRTPKMPSWCIGVPPLSAGAFWVFPYAVGTGGNLALRAGPYFFEEIGEKNTKGEGGSFPLEPHFGGEEGGGGGSEGAALPSPTTPPRPPPRPGGGGGWLLSGKKKRTRQPPSSPSPNNSPPTPPPPGPGRGGGYWAFRCEGRRPGTKAEVQRLTTSHQRRESRGKNLFPLGFFPPFLLKKWGPGWASQGSLPFQRRGKKPNTPRPGMPLSSALALIIPLKLLKMPQQVLLHPQRPQQRSVLVVKQGPDLSPLPHQVLHLLVVVGDNVAEGHLSGAPPATGWGCPPGRRGRSFPSTRSSTRSLAMLYPAPVT